MFGGSGEGRAREPEDRRACLPAMDFAEYSMARERYFAHLRLDCEVRRLEAAWRMRTFVNADPDAPRKWLTE